MNEEWRPILGFETFYEVSNQGRVRRKKVVAGTHAGRVLRPVRFKSGYVVVTLSFGSRKQRVIRAIHRLVADAFLGPCPQEGWCVNHLNGIKDDNRDENLEWTTRSKNSLHAFSLGLMVPTNGERDGMAKLSAKEVRMIRNVSGLNHVQIARAFGVSHQCIQLIRAGKRWKHIL